MLEGRVVPAVYYWIGPAGGADWNTGAYWQNPITHTIGTVPGAGDYATFGDPGTDGPCTVSGTVTVDRVTMTGQYSGTLAVGPGASLAATSLFHQNGTLALEGGAVTSNNNFYVYGTVTATPDGAGTSSTLTAGAELLLQGPSVTVLGGTATDPGLVLTAGNLSTATAIFVGAPTGPSGALAIVGSLTANSTTGIDVYAEGFLGFTAAGAGSTFTVQGTMNLYGATVATDTPLKLNLGTLNCLGGMSGVDDVIDGDLTDQGAVHVGSAAGVSTQLDVLGSLTMDGVLNLYGGSALTFPTGAGADTFTIQGEVNMYGATIIMDPVRVPTVDVTGGILLSLAGSGAADFVDGNLMAGGLVAVGTAGGGFSSLAVTGAGAVPAGGGIALYEGSALLVGGLPGFPLAIEGQVDLFGASLSSGTGIELDGGTLVTHGGAGGAADSVDAGPGFPLVNAGTIQFDGLAHALQLGGEYAQGAQGTLVMRISATTNDVFSIGAGATLDGTLTVTGAGILPPPGTVTWTIITTGGGFGGTDFATFNLPLGMAGMADPLDINNYIVI